MTYRLSSSRLDLSSPRPPRTALPALRSSVRFTAAGPEHVASGDVQLPRIEAAFRAVEQTLSSLGIDRPHTLRSPQVVEEALEGRSSLDGTLVILDPAELRAAEADLEETVADERSGGSVFVSLPSPAEWAARRGRYRDLASSSAAFAFVEPGTPVRGFGRLIPVPRLRALKGWRIFLADTPGFRVLVVSRPRSAGGFIGLWTGNPDLVDELGDVLRGAARDAGHQVPAPAAPVPPMLGVSGTQEVWKKAAELRGLREAREGELREIARAAALRGVAMRRERARASAQGVGPVAKAPAA
jgi:hypothetical protein